MIDDISREMSREIRANIRAIMQASEADRYGFAAECGRQIKEARKKWGISQDDLARMCNVSPTTIFNIESGETMVKGWLLFGIAFALGIPLDKLFRDIANKLPKPLVLP